MPSCPRNAHGPGRSDQFPAPKPLAVAILGGVLVTMLFPCQLMPISPIDSPGLPGAGGHASELSESMHSFDPFFPVQSGNGEQKR